MAPLSPALIDTRKNQICYGRLIDLMAEARGFFIKNGMGSKSNIAAVMNGGIETAFAFLAVSEVASFVPLNPSFSKEQFKYHFELLKVSGVLLEGLVRGGKTIQSAREAALELGLPIIEMAMIFSSESQDDPIVKWHMDGHFKTHSHRGEGLSSAAAQLSDHDETALVVCTSGTTATPKVMAIRNSQLCISAESRGNVFELTQSDCCLMITPCYRSVTINSMLTSLLTGGSVICAGGFEPAEVIELLKKTATTWFIGSPAIFRMMADYANSNKIRIDHKTLRFVRVRGASLPESL